MLFADNVNQTNSAIKNVIDTWYENNMTNYTKYLESVVFCNDRSIIDYGGWNSNGGSVTSEGLAFKNSGNITDLYCAVITDSFSTDNSKAKLTYPVGLVSLADVELLGNDNARKSGVNQWLMSPDSLLYTDTIPYSRVRVLGDVGDNLWAATTSRVFYVRPSVSLAANTMYVSGTGSTTDPYIVDLNAPTVVQETIIDGEREKTIRITASDDYGLSSDNKYKYYLSTSETELTGGEWKDYTSGEIFTITGENETRYLWIYPVMDNAGNINDGKDDVNTPYLLMTVTFKNKNTLYNVLRKEYASGSGLSRLYSGKHNDSYNETGEENIYHFYGSDDEAGTNVLSKNNVSFGGFCWKMIRTTDTGGTKLIYNGVPKDENGKKVCTNSGTDTAIGTSGFASASDSPAYAGYMYNTVYPDKSKSMSSTDLYMYAKSFTYSDGIYKLSDDATSIDVTDSTQKEKLNNAHYTCFNTTGECETIYNVNYIDSNNLMYYIELQNGKSVEDALNEMLYADDVNKTNSTIKNTVDTWYASNMTRYTKYLEDTVFCNDRTIADYGGWNSNGGDVSIGVITFTNGQESNDSFLLNDNIYCSNVTDRFSVGNSKAKLTYPVGMISANEMYLLGNNNARKSGVNQWLMTPEKFNYSNIAYSRHRVLGGDGLNDYPSHSITAWSVRPSVSIASNIEYVSGTGSTTDPYVIGLTLSATTLTDSGSKKTVKITVNGSSDLSSENKYQYYLSTSSTTLTGGEWKDYTLGEEFTLIGTNGTRYLWIYPIKDNAGNISDGRDNISEPYYISSYKFVSTYTVAYVGNKFSTVPKVENGITVTYDPDTSILTLNGTQTTQNVNLMLASQSFSENEEYRTTLEYVSGSVTNAGSCAFVTEPAISTGAAVSTRNYADTSLPTSSGSRSSTLTITSVGASEGTHLFNWLYIGTASGTTFTNYKIKVTVTKVDTKKVNYNEPYGTLGDTPTRYGNTFAGWYTEEFSGTQVTSETIMAKKSDHNIYAHWTLNNYTLTINPNGGTYNSSTSNTTMTIQYGKTQTIANPTRSGYTFNGWTLSGTGSKMSGTTFTMGYENATLIANWATIDPVSLSYTGAAQYYTAPATGNYEITLYGAKGGNGGLGLCSGGSGGAGGNGGYVKATVRLTQGQTYTVWVGGKGTDSSYGDTQEGTGGLSDGVTGGTGVRVSGGGGGGGGSSYIALGDTVYLRANGGGGGGGGADGGWYRKSNGSTTCGGCKDRNLGAGGARGGNGGGGTAGGNGAANSCQASGSAGSAGTYYANTTYSTVTESGSTGTGNGTATIKYVS